MTRPRSPSRRWPGLLGLALACLALPGPATPPAQGQTARTYVIDPERSRLAFSAVSRFMDAEGTFGRFDGEVTVDPGRPESATGRLVVHVASLNTQNAIRDRHLRSDDFLDVSRHPTATFVTASVRRDAGRLVVDGQLTIRGTSRPVSVPVILSPDGVALRITGELVLSRRAFGVLYQSTLNPIRDEVRLVWDLIAVTR